MRFDLFSSGRLYQALKEASYPDLPDIRTLRRWIRNDAPPASIWPYMERVMTVDTKKEAAPPEWARRLEKKLDAIYTRQETIATAVADDAIVKLTQILTTGEESDRIRVFRRALAGALSEVGRDEPQSDEPGGKSDEGGGEAESKSPPSPSDPTREE